MKGELKILFGDIIYLNKDERLKQARMDLLLLYSYLNEMGMSPMAKMGLLENIVYVSALIDGDINEDEVTFISSTLNTSVSLEEAKRVSEHIKIKEVEESILNNISKFEIDPGMALCRVILIGELSDSDDLNQMEEEFLEKALFKLL